LELINKNDKRFETSLWEACDRFVNTVENQFPRDEYTYEISTEDNKVTISLYNVDHPIMTVVCKNEEDAEKVRQDVFLFFELYKKEVNQEYDA